MRRTLALAAVLACVLALPPAAHADRARPIYAGFGGGPYFVFDCCRVHGRISGEVGWHFGGVDTGFVMAVEAITTFGDDYIMFLGGLRLGGDIEVTGNQETAIILRPNALFGVGFRDFQGFGFDNAHGLFAIQPAFDIRFAFADRILVFWVRPAAFDVIISWDRYTRGDWEVTGAYQAMAGFDFQF